jgi:5'-methylthioadenosine phosphorylase
MTTLAVIGGSGAYDLFDADILRAPVETREILTPFGVAQAIRKYSAGSLSFYFLSRHGEGGYKISAPFVNYRANIWALKELGVERIISWSGPGIINPSFDVGSYAVPHDIIDQTRNRASTFFTKGGLGFIRMSSPFCGDLRHALIYSLATLGLKSFDEAVYICAEGPRLETPAEIRLFHSYGADIVGMTLAPEAFLARELEMCYAPICYLVNFAEGIAPREYRRGELFEGMQTDEEKTAVDFAARRLPEVAIHAFNAIADSSRTCECKDAMLRYRRKGVISDDFHTWINP